MSNILSEKENKASVKLWKCLCRKYTGFVLLIIFAIYKHRAEPEGTGRS